MQIREESLARLASGEGFDVLILGGGVNGVAVLRELALNGVSALLVDSADFCRGATGASSRMAHGGLRYLENREFKLVAESARERNRLLHHAAHFTRPLEVTVPLSTYVRGLPGSILRFLGFDWKGNTFSTAGLKIALTLYEYLGRAERALPSHQTVLERKKFPRRLAQHYKAVVSYFDARIRNPEALVLEMIEEALAAQPRSAALNHAAWHHDGSGGFTITVGDAGPSKTLRPKLVVNASGAWVDDVNAALGCSTRYIRPVKGAHLLIRNDALFERMANRAFYFDDGTGRMVIAYPLDHTVLLGTTEITVGDPSDDTIASQEISYLTRSISTLFDDIEIGPKDIVFMTTGIRPLQAGGATDANRANRDHRLAEDQLQSGTPLLSLIGGKWTTFRAFGEQAADRIFRHLNVARRVSTADRDYPGAIGFPRDEMSMNRARQSLAARFVISVERAANLFSRYGAIAERVAAFCSEKSDQPLANLPSFTRNEMIWLIRERAAMHLDDLIFRRSQIALDGLCTPSLVRELGHLLAEQRRQPTGWAESEIDRCLNNPALSFAASGQAPRGELRHG
ncbi:glycerol-3-phosphate dehydrogenase/oxidase [Rhizobium sp. C4]|uniref:glycerol-3-phosphate dehydrogenase/oxidase n=1 Tax=Rhizobium sp. C4 TaxID=1349800 RepID=UPI001E2D5DC3|nr:glycerol-3-phosphate dehydrogenase/oxidase [Rhizobium sp. C4]MCD2172772.1 glycerol-3-phosphate dehydrogenase/oxidase [Rhizobium sp. C4]